MATQIPITRDGILLALDSEEAGYLLDLLSAHVGGTLTINDAPLGRVRKALEGADVRRLYPEVAGSGVQGTGAFYPAMSRYAVLNLPTREV